MITVLEPFTLRSFFIQVIMNHKSNNYAVNTLSDLDVDGLNAREHGVSIVLDLSICLCMRGPCDDAVQLKSGVCDLHFK